MSSICTIDFTNQLLRLNMRVIQLYIRRIQGTSFYRRVARLLRPSIEIKEADEAYMQQALNWLNHVQLGQTAPSNFRATSFVALKKGRVIGFVDLVKRSEQYYRDDSYWLYSLIVSTPYRRMGIGEELTRMAMEKSRKEGIKKLFLTTGENNDRAVRLYRKLGFETRVIPEFEKYFEDERRTFGHRPICMAVDLN